MASIQVAQRELHALGITAWQDAWVEEDLLRAYRRLDDEGGLTARVVTSLWWDRHRGPEQLEGLIERRAWGSGGRVDANTVKLMLDGCPESCTGSMLRPYEGSFGERHGTGIQFIDGEVHTEAAVRLDAAGFQIHQHALGDRAIRTALDAIAAARAANGANDHRHHIAHLQLPDPADVPRLAQLDVIANVQPYWAAPDPMIERLTRPRVGDRASWLYPIADLARSGARARDGERLAGLDARPLAGDRGRRDASGDRRTRARRARRDPAGRPGHGARRLHRRHRVPQPRRRRGNGGRGHARRSGGARP